MSHPEFNGRSALSNQYSSETRLPIHPGDRPSSPHEDMDYSTLLRELMQLRGLDEDRVARIYHLEQALDQALLCIEELRVQVREQGLLESQLAATEEFSSIQQKAISRLRLQMDQQQVLIESMVADFSDANEHHALLQEMVGVMKAIAAQQDQEIALFQTCQSALQSESEQHAHRLEAESNRLQTLLDQRERQILALEAEALTAHAQTVRLQAELETANQRLRSLQTNDLSAEFVANASEPQALLDYQDFVSEESLPQPSFQPSSALHLPLELSELQAQIKELELQLSKQVGTQARWQQRCLELEAESQRHQLRTSETQQQIAEMQEEILRQTKQAGEYEAAIQHWKDRHLNTQRILVQLQDLLKRILPYSGSESNTEQNPELGEVLEAIQVMLVTESDDTLAPSATSAARFNALDLPDFLLRRRNYRKKIQASPSEPEQ